jgi:hypothetical protein
MDFNHLILLIGTNPLPNYVVAKYFLGRDKKLKTLSAIYTKETFAIAQHLQKILLKEYPTLRFNYWGLTDPGNAAAIRKEIAKNLKAAARDKLHLNYTGGTKNMAVQAYRTIFVETEPGSASFSYLDAHDFKLKADDGHALSGDLRSEIVLRFEDLLALHDCKTIRRSADDDWSAANQIIHQFVAEDLIRDFISWKNETIRKIFYENDYLKKPARVSRDRLFGDHSFAGEAQRLIAAFPEKLAWKFDEQDCLIIPDPASAFEKKKGDFVTGILYLDGGWLEFYVRDLLQRKIKADGADFQIMYNWHIVKGEAEKDFEIDVMLLNGYQLCGISITTAAAESLCKGKAFEILHRVQQMGGDEARAVLVSTLTPEKAKKIQDDLKTDTGGQQQLRILGLEDLAPEALWQKIKALILGE